MKLLIVDGNSILNRAYYGVKPLTNHAGIFTNAVYGFFNILLKAVDDLSPTAIAVAFDMKAPTFRHKAVASYKANRKGMPPELAMQLPYTKKLLTAMGYSVITCEGWEADDILGTLAQASADSDTDCVLLTGDRDNLQLIQDHVSVRLCTNKEPIFFDTDRFFEEYGFSPIHLIDLKALMGDSSDNISGVPGIGEKTATGLVRTYGTIEALYENLDTAQLTPAVKRKLEVGVEAAKESKWLATIAKDAPISTNLEDYHNLSQDTDTLAAILTELELFKLMQRLHIQPSVDSSSADHASAESESNIKPEVVAISKSELEQLSNSRQIIDFLLKDSILYLAWERNVTRITDPLMIRTFLCSDVPKRTFSAKPVYRKCMEEGRTLGNLILDAEICAYLLNPSVSEYQIDKLCAGAGIPLDSDLGDYTEIAALPALCKQLEREVIEQDMEQLLREIEMPLIEVLADMEHIGVRLHTEGVEIFGQALITQIDALQKQIYELAGHSFNILSPKQLGVVLFEELALPAGKKTKTGWSTNAEVLENLRDQHSIIEPILQYRKLTKLSSTYVDGLLKAVSPDSRIHTCYRQTETRTGRISSTEPNLQNIPVRTELGREMRKFFIAEEGCTLLDADYSQIELRLVAHLCDDENMRQTFKENRDIHRSTAAQVFRLPEDMITKEMRSAAKAVNFGILYGIGPFSLSKDIGVSVKKAEEYINSYLDSFPSIREFMERTVEQAKETGYVTTLFGRKRYVPELRASNKMTQAAGKRIAMNTPVQGTAADIIKTAMVRVWKRLKEEVPTARLILQIHDELIVEAPIADAPKAADILKTEMENSCRLSVPLTVEVEEGKSWYDAKG